jgi:hypothetical protein
VKGRKKVKECGSNAKVKNKKQKKKKGKET